MKLMGNALNFGKVLLLVGILFLSVLGQNGSEEEATSSGSDEIEVRIDFTSGSVFANEAPTVVRPISHHAIVLGTSDSVVAKLTDVFDDPESGSQLHFSAESFNRDLVRIGLNPTDSSLKLFLAPDGVEGSTSIKVTASDGAQEVSDTFTVVVKELFEIADTITDTLLKSGHERKFFNRSIAHIIPSTEDSTSEAYTFKALSDNEPLVLVSENVATKELVFEIADSGFGLANVEVTVIDSDQFEVRDTFTVNVRKSYGYDRKQEMFNPGVSLINGLDYSGGSFNVWFNDMIGTSLGGYYQWDQNGIGAELAVMGKPHLNFILQPYASISAGYHRQTVTIDYEDLSFSYKKDVPLFVARAVGGVGIWMGETKRNVIFVEAGYAYGTAEYSTVSRSDIGQGLYTVDTDRFDMEPFHLRVGYTFYFKLL